MEPFHYYSCPVSSHMSDEQHTVCRISLCDPRDFSNTFNFCPLTRIKGNFF
jgi:hypothetical protein